MPRCKSHNTKRLELRFHALCWAMVTVACAWSGAQALRLLVKGMLSPKFSGLRLNALG